MAEPHVYRQRWSIVVLIVTALFSIVVPILTFIYETPLAGLQDLAQLAVLPTAVLFIFVIPKLEVAADYVRIRNVFRTITVPWSQILAVEMRWALRIRTPEGTHAAWAVPLPGRTTGVGSLVGGRPSVAVPFEPSRTQEMRAAPEAAQHILRHLESTTQETEIANDQRVAVRWNWVSAVMLAITLTLSLAINLATK
ncbi:PH domain-containing protein [Saxibacter everestensis]|uniref:PH domain-containing protein n=1 Tax=Saxibacter everestensis TaxID=2909229 RepID=A0ABY8QVL2_9MICO|nr:PH domain-containing protein [Brevibacteriaceae bacterium ZFBP1038]